MSSRYNHKVIEKKWQDIWSNNNTFQTTKNKDKKKYYVLDVSYPSGKIHMGHVRNYALGDVVARYKKMKGSMFYIQWDGMLLVCLLKMLL